MLSTTNQLRVVVLGGGVAALSAAYELSHPRQKGQFKVTVYQLGWRLGGKCASGRDLEYHMRIKEHGPHILFGFYDNGFELMEECYAALRRPASHPFRTFEDALVGSDDCCAMEKLKGRWEPWPVPAFALPGKPGTEGAPDRWSVALNAISRLADHIQKADNTFPAAQVAVQKLSDDAISSFNALLNDCCDGLAAIEMKERLAYSPANHEPQHLLLARAFWLMNQSIANAEKKAKSIQIQDGKVSHRDALELAGYLRCVQQTIHFVQAAFKSPSDDIRRWIILADLGATVLLGATLDELLLPTKETLLAANQLEYCDWLRRFDAMPVTIDSAVVRAMYDTVFGYVEGDPSRGRNVQAGSAVRAQLDFLFCRGHLFWKMRAGTGDVIAAPLYEYLCKTGVEFEFFRQVERLVPSSDGEIAEVHIVRQAEVSAPPYRPLRECKGICVWPDRPDLQQLVNGQDYRGVDFESGSSSKNAGCFVLRAGEHFDAIVLGISLASLPSICAALADASDDWKRMLASGRTVATQGLQLWIDKPTGASGWQGPAHPVVTSFDACLLDTWLDASHAIAFEDWGAETPPAQMAMICGPLPEHGRQNSEAEFFKSSCFLWPNFCSAGTFDHARLRGPVFATDIHLSDRYVQTPPGSVRLAPGDSRFSNLVLAGDWTNYGMNLGCFEGAVISGRLAANALGGSPRKILRGQPDAPRTTRDGSYVEHHPPQTLGGPIVFPEVTMWAFFLRGEIDLLTKLCRRFFDLPTAGRVTFTPLSQIVIMMISELANGYFRDQPDRGHATEREVAFSIPGIYTCRDTAGNITASGPAAFMPYLFVDNPVALMTGREVLGYFKQLGEVGLPGRSGSKEDFFLNVFGAEQMNATTQWGQQRLITVTGRDRTIQRRGRVELPLASEEKYDRADFVSEIQNALKWVLGSRIPGRTILALGNVRGLLTGSMSQIFLKQFRAEDGSNAAAYQAVTVAEYQVTRIRSVRPTQSFDIKFHPLASLPIARELGLSPDVAEIGVEVDFSMTLDVGRVIWRAQ